jgi:3-keto-5-aminohexanoate cleavage enzyme
MKKIVIAVAPTGGWGRGQQNPISPDEIAAEVAACAAAGAAMVHLHARDMEGRLTPDLTVFNQAVDLIKNKCDILVEASTGGLSDLTPQERALPVNNANAEMGSLNLGSLNFGDQVYCNVLPHIRLWIELMGQAGVKPSLEIFDTGHMETALHLIDENLIAPPCNFSFIFNVRWGMPYHPVLLDLLIAKTPSGSRWGGIFVGSRHFTDHLQAAAKGASVLRVGFEDSRVFNGQMAASNVDLVVALCTALEQNGFAIAGPQDARDLLLG